MEIITFDTSSDVKQLVKSISESDNDNINLYHANRTNEKSSLEYPDICEWFAELFDEVRTHEPAAVYEKLTEESIAEMFICELAHRIYKDIGDLEIAHRYAKGINVGESTETVYDVILRVKNQ